MNDVEIIRRAQGGDEKAYEELYKAYYKTAYFYALKVCKNESDAQDIAQDAMLDVKRYLPSLRDENYFRPWLYQIVAHRCSKMFRKEKHVVNHGEVAEGLGTQIREERQDHIPESTMHFQSDKDVLQYFIDKLPVAQRSVIVLFYLEQFSIKEIATIMNTPEGTVKSRMATARKTLYEALAKYQKDNTPITFHTLDALLLGCMAAAFQGVKVSVPLLTSPNVKKGRNMNLSQSSFFVKAALVGCASLAGVGGISLVNNYFKSQNETEVPTLDQKALSPEAFPAINYQNKKITSARDAYFVLLNFACCEEEFNRKTPEELEAIKPVYQAYKKAQAENNVAKMSVSWEPNFVEKMK